MRFDGRCQIDCRLSRCTFSAENGCVFGRKREKLKTTKYIFVRKRNWLKPVKIFIFGGANGNEIQLVSSHNIQHQITLLIVSGIWSIKWCLFQWIQCSLWRNEVTPNLDLKVTELLYALMPSTYCVCSWRAICLRQLSSCFFWWYATGVLHVTTFCHSYDVVRFRDSRHTYFICILYIGFVFVFVFGRKRRSSFVFVSVLGRK